MTSIGLRHIYDGGGHPLCINVNMALIRELTATSPVEAEPLANGVLTCWLCAAYQDWRNRHE